MVKRKLFAIILIAVACFGHAQVIITEEANPTPTNSNVLLEFGSEPKGIILPLVEEAPGAIDGTFIVNTTDGVVQVREAGSWKDLTDPGEVVAHSYINTGTDIGEGVIIGAETTTKPGALVLESTTQALVLPKVENPHLSILSPIAGTIVYDTTSDMLAVYDGANWSFWK